MKSLFIFLFLTLAVISYSQPGSMDPTFNLVDGGFGFGFGANDKITASALQNDGKILIGGTFYLYNGKTVNKLARLNSDGSLDHTFNDGGSGIDGNNAGTVISAIVVQDDGKIIAGGNFIGYNNSAINALIRVNEDGSIDSLFQQELGWGSKITAIALQSDGKILLGGSFKLNNGLNVNVARLDINGNIDSTFNYGILPNKGITAIHVLNDGKILIAHNFSNGTSAVTGNVNRFFPDGSIDTTFSIGLGVNGYIKTLDVHDNGKIVIGGSFTYCFGIMNIHIALLNTDGSLDNNFNPGSGGMDQDIDVCVFQPDGKILAGGYFTIFNGDSTEYLIRLNTDGSLDSTFITGTGADNAVLCIIIDANEDIVIGGNFRNYNDYTWTRILRMHQNGTIDEDFNRGTGANGSVLVILPDEADKIFVSGGFTKYNGEFCNNLIRIHEDGWIDTTFQPVLDSIVLSFKQNDGKLLVNKYNTHKLYRLFNNGSIDSTFNCNVNWSSNGGGKLQNDGKILVSARLNDEYKLVRINTDGSLESIIDLTPFMNYGIYAYAIQDDGKIVICGKYKETGGSFIFRFLRLNADGTKDVLFNEGIVNNSIQDIAIQDDGKILIGGYFTTYNNNYVGGFARINSDGSLDTNLNAGSGAWGAVSSIKILSDNKIMLMGGLCYYDGVPRKGIARLNTDGSLDHSFDPGTGTDGGIGCCLEQQNGRIMIGGGFFSYDGIGRNCLARLLVNYHDTTAICDGETYQWNGMSLSDPGDYTYSLTNSNGTDSICQLHLIVGSPYNTVEYDTICVNEILNWHGLLLTAPGVYYDSLTTIIGCDSIFELHLAVHDIDTSLTVSNATITATTNADAYQWVDCDNDFAPISGATAQSYTAIVNGHYAVVLTEGACIDTSSCVEIAGLGIETKLHGEFIVYPNPFTHELIIKSSSADGKLKYAILNLLGEEFLSGEFQDEVHISTNQLIPGMYLVKVEQEGRSMVKKIIKQ